MSEPSKKKALLIDLDNTIFDFSGAHERDFDKEKTPYPQSQGGFFLFLEPLKDAVRVVNRFLDDDRFDVWVCTAPSPRNPYSYTEKIFSVLHHFGQRLVDKVHISPNKGMVKGDYLIDDWACGKGQEDFDGELVHFGSKEYPDWLAVELYFFGDNESETTDLSGFKIGIDIHGVLDLHPEKFAALAHAVYDGGGEVHIITGIKYDDLVKSELESYGIPYTHYFSIVEQIEIAGVHLEWRDGLPYTDDSDYWDNAKSIYCQQQGIHFMFDDSPTYKNTFDNIETTYLHVINPNRKIHKTR